MAIRRADGRAPREIRHMSIKWEKLSRADGSARFSFGTYKHSLPIPRGRSSSFFHKHTPTGTTSALVSLAGPTDVPPAREHPSKAYLDVHYRPVSGVPGPSARALAGVVRGCLEGAVEVGRYPRTMVQVVVQGLNHYERERRNAGNEDSDLDEEENEEVRRSRVWEGEYLAANAACMNAVSCAAVDAGSLALRGVLCAVAVCRTGGGALYLDPSTKEWGEADARGWFVFLVTKESEEEEEDSLVCVPVYQSWRCREGEEDEEDVEDARDVAEDGAKAVWGTIRGAVGEVYGEVLGKPKEIKTKVEEEKRSESESEDNEEAMEI